MDAVGDVTKRSKGPCQEIVRDVNNAIHRVLNLAEDGGHEGRTQLDSRIYHKWVADSGDPETEVGKWLDTGTPMGIEVDAVNVGVFPEVVDECPAELRRPLELFNEIFVNYTSVEDSPYGKDVLGS